MALSLRGHLEFRRRIATALNDIGLTTWEDVKYWDAVPVGLNAAINSHPDKNRFLTRVRHAFAAKVNPFELFMWDVVVPDGNNLTISLEDYLYNRLNVALFGMPFYYFFSLRGRKGGIDPIRLGDAAWRINIPNSNPYYSASDQERLILLAKSLFPLVRITNRQSGGSNTPFILFDSEQLFQFSFPLDSMLAQE